MSSTGTWIFRSSSFLRPASTISHARRGPTRNRPISSSGRCVAERPIRCGSSPPFEVTPCESRSSVSARWEPRFDCATAWISSTITASTPVRISRARGAEHQIERLRGRDQDVGRLAQHRLPVLLRRVAGAQADRDRRADARERRAQVALDVVGERLQRRDVDDADAIAKPLRLHARAGRSPRGTRRASCQSPSGRRSGRSCRTRSAASPVAWAGVGSSNESSNQARTGSENGSRGESLPWFRSAANRSSLRSRAGRLQAHIRSFDARSSRGR